MDLLLTSSLWHHSEWWFRIPLSLAVLPIYWTFINNSDIVWIIIAKSELQLILLCDIHIPKMVNISIKQHSFRIHGQYECQVELPLSSWHSYYQWMPTKCSSTLKWTCLFWCLPYLYIFFNFYVHPHCTGKMVFFSHLVSV